MLRSSIHPSILQPMLESATNAAAKGQAQWFTPIEWARLLSIPLPRYRPVIVDLTCGSGNLLHGTASPSTKHLLGCDIQAMDKAEGERLKAKTTDAATPEGSGASAFVQADLCRLFPLLSAVDWQADLFALNPPWDLHWHSALSLQPLALSLCPAVQLAWAAHDGRTARGTIDSTVATLCMALDRCSPWGEGYLIANAATVDRLIFAPDAPHAALAAHIWARLDIPGNICDPGKPKAEGERLKAKTTGAAAPEGSATSAFSLQPSAFATAVLYFARGHTAGPRFQENVGCRMKNEETASAGVPSAGDSSFIIHHSSLAAAAEAALRGLSAARPFLRHGSACRPGTQTEDTLKLWRAASQEWDRLQGRRPDWNLWLNPDGTIATYLTPFEEAMEPKAEGQRLKAKTTGAAAPEGSGTSAFSLQRSAFSLRRLHGKHPASLVMQKADRLALLAAVGRLPSGTSAFSLQPSALSPWRVAPAVLAAVDAALLAYEKARAPLRPLNEIQRIGYLDEQDFITAKPAADLSHPSDASYSMGHLFPAGEQFPLRTETVSVTRDGQKPNLDGGLDKVQWTGSELAIWIRGADGAEHLFMEARLRKPGVTIGLAPNAKCKMKNAETTSAGVPPEEDSSFSIHPSSFPIEFTLQDLAAHFEIPEVPDVAALDPAGYRRNLELLAQIEHIANAGAPG